MISLVVASSVLSFSESWADLQRSQLNSLTQGLFQVNSALLSGFFDISREITRVAENTRGTWYHDKEQNGKCRNGRYSWCYGGQCLDVTYGLACLAGLKRGRRNLGARGRKERISLPPPLRVVSRLNSLSLPFRTPATQATYGLESSLRDHKIYKMPASSSFSVRKGHAKMLLYVLEKGPTEKTDNNKNGQPWEIYR